jgi:hypothetical protein
MPHTIKDGYTFPMPCPVCQHVAAMPFLAGTTLDNGTIRVGMRCRDCRHEWRFDMPVTTDSARGGGTQGVPKRD